MSYSQYFNFGSGPEIKTGSAKWIKAGLMPVNVTYDYVSNGSKNNKANDAFDKIMAGHDAEVSSYTNKLKSIYDSYGQYAKDYTGEIQPIIDALGGDIKSMEGYIGDYNKTLDNNKDTFLNGIVLDPNANRTRAEYTGAVANEYDNARESLKRNMTSQGLNPYSNTGADRQLAMERAQDLGGAAGQAYTDWRAGFNRDKQAQQNATAQYLGLKDNTLNAQSSIMQARKGVGDFQGNILNSKISAGKERAAGYENLTSLAEARRQEALGLGQQQQANSRQNADIKQQLNAKLTARDKNISGGGSSYGGTYYKG